MLSTQPEQVPAIAYYLPAVTHFATPLGAVPDPRVMDWRNALSRFEHSSVTTRLAPVVRALPAGHRVLLVVPMTFREEPGVDGGSSTAARGAGCRICATIPV